jgi:hypothetical protein
MALLSFAHVEDAVKVASILWCVWAIHLGAACILLGVLDWAYLIKNVFNKVSILLVLINIDYINYKVNIAHILRALILLTLLSLTHIKNAALFALMVFFPESVKGLSFILRLDVFKSD